VGEGTRRIMIESAAIATVISSVIATLVSVLLNRRSEKKSLDSQLNEILDIAIQYPYLENKVFTENWTSKYNTSDEKALRYELYATRVFNYLSLLAKFHRYNFEKIEKELAVRAWVRLHKKYWYDPTVPNENIDTYDKPFVNMVNNCLSGGNAK
jgi:hypothetical protein